MKRLLLAAAAVIALAASPALAERYDCGGYWLNINNESDYNVVEVYAKCVDCSNWSGDILGEYYLEPGASIQVELDGIPGTGSGYHVFNFYAVSEGGEIEWSKTFDLCVQENWTLYNPR